MYVHQGGALYGFCPAKSTWDAETVNLFNTLVVALKYGKLLDDKSLLDQPSFFIDLLAWFSTVYEQTEFASRMRMIFGDGSKKKTQGPSNGNKRRS